jgi:hypothetical protein
MITLICNEHVPKISVNLDRTLHSLEITYLKSVLGHSTKENEPHISMDKNVKI